MVKCVHKRCAGEVVTGTRCEKHHEHHRKEVAARSRQRLSLGLCGLCSNQAVAGKARCENHDTSLWRYKCGYCREYGHNRITCIKRKEREAMTSEEKAD